MAHEPAFDPPLIPPLREIVPIVREELDALKEQAATKESLRDLREDMEVEFDKAQERFAKLDAQSIETNMRLARIEEKNDERMDKLLTAILDQNKAHTENNPLKSTTVQIVLGVVLLIVVGAAVGKDFILDTPTIDLTTTEGP